MKRSKEYKVIIFMTTRYDPSRTYKVDSPG
jgi:hypothetical protein